MMDTHGISFHELGLDTETVAETVSNEWLDDVLVLYKKISLLKIGCHKRA